MLLVMSACRRMMAMGIKYSSEGARSLCTLVGARLQNINTCIVQWFSPTNATRA